MHLFDKVDLKETQTLFYITMVLVSLLTWIISASFIWGVDRRQKLREKWQMILTWMAYLCGKQTIRNGKEKEQDAEVGMLGAILPLLNLDSPILYCSQHFGMPINITDLRMGMH